MLYLAYLPSLNPVEPGAVEASEVALVRAADADTAKEAFITQASLRMIDAEVVQIREVDADLDAECVLVLANDACLYPEVLR